MNGIHEVGGSIPPGSTILHLFLFFFKKLAVVFGNPFWGVSTSCSLFDLFHPLDRHPLPIGGGGVPCDFLECGVATDRHDLVRGETRLGGDPAECLSQSMWRQPIRQACPGADIMEPIGEACVGARLAPCAHEEDRANSSFLHVIQNQLQLR